MPQLIDRRRLKADMKQLLRTAQVPAKAMAALYLAILLGLDLADVTAGGLGSGLLGTFVSVMTGLLSMVLSAGFVLYCMAVRRGQRAEFLTLFDGFSFVGKIVGLNIVIAVFTALWSLLFVIPGIIASYRYRFALYNLYENPGIGIMEALDMSKQQTMGYKEQLFMLDLTYLGWSLLASVPALVLEWSISYQAIQQSVNLSSPAAIAAMLAISSVTWVLLMDLWSGVVSLFYLPVYQCTELGYFDIAKETSGVGLGAARKSPDGLGGL
ncbi:DUF975 family protein [uncultured Oscillibacter sp.]|uniref:DUF975 family protein n=1 Tax=uncultured Oscillibacter sp. TaxID=876091 RepID=UPI0025DBEA73|nr:DUF975 family protein [uncultured Oscillibacter sp.]